MLIVQAKYFGIFQPKLMQDAEEAKTTILPYWQKLPMFESQKHLFQQKLYSGKEIVDFQCFRIELLPHCDVPNKLRVMTGSLLWQC